MTEEQSRVLSRADKTGMILVGDSSICPGIHFCPDWDNLPIFIDSPEADLCTCGRLDGLLDNWEEPE